MSEATKVRELDAAVAMLVMGCEVNYNEDKPMPYLSCGCASKKHVDDSDRDRWLYSEIPEYSTDIAAAWCVVEEMRERGYYLNLHVPGPKPCGDVGLYSAEFHDALAGLDDYRKPGIAVRITSAALAICLAALNAGAA